MKVLAAVLGSMALASCAPPPVTLYTMQAPALRGAEVPLGTHPVVIGVARVTLPDDLDTQDIVVRRGSVLESSHTGRWASRLSLGVTDLLTGRLAASRPDALVTDQPETTAPTYRLLINISRLDLAVNAGAEYGTAILEANWTTVALNPAVPVRRDRTRVVLTGPAGNASDIVALTRAAVVKLASAIDSSWLR